VVKYEFDNFVRPEEEDTDFLDWLEKRLIRIEERSKQFASKDDPKQIKPDLDDFSHLVEDLDIYLDREERHVQRLLKWKNFFKHRPRRPPGQQ
jgi:hypothetical protein